MIYNRDTQIILVCFINTYIMSNMWFIKSSFKVHFLGDQIETLNMVYTFIALFMMINYGTFVYASYLL